MKLTLHFFLLLTAALTALFPLTASAQVPGLLNYQGKVAVGPTPFTGSGQFKFALVNGSGTTTYWSHDGSSTAASEPASAVTRSVLNGLYAVLLGDSTIAGMTSPIPASVFANSDVRLRVWFSDGTNGSQLLTPDKRIAAVAYAMVAASLDEAGMTAVQQASQAAVDAAITAAVTTTTTAKAASDATIADLRSQLVTKDASITKLTADKTLLTTQLAAANAKCIADTATLNRRLTEATANIDDLEQTLGLKDARITELIDSEQAAKDALAVEKAKYNDLILYTNYGITSAENDISAATLGRIGDLNRFQTDIRSAELRGLNEGITTTAVTVGGKTTTSRVVTGSSPQVKLGTVIYGYSIYSRQIYRLERLFSVKLLTCEVVYEVVTDTPGTPNGTVVTTTPGLNGLNAQVTSLTGDKTTLTADKTLLQTQLTATNTTITGLNTQVTSLTADKQALTTQVTELTNTIGQKNEVITSLSTQVQELGDALTNAQTQFSFEKAAFEKQIEDFGNILLLEDALKDQGVTITAETRRWDGFNMTSQSITTDTRTGVFIRRGPLVPDNVNPWGTIIVTKIPGIAALQAQIRGLNEGTTITAVTLNGVTTTTTTVTGSSPLVTISVVTTNTPGTPNGTVVTTTPGINGLNAQITALQNPPAS